MGCTSAATLSDSAFKAPIPVRILQKGLDACRHYMNTTSDQAGLKELEYSLGAVRKIVGLNVRLLVEDYGLAVPSNLEDMMPQM